MGKERTLYNWFASGIRKNNPLMAHRTRIDRIESYVSVGIPDVNFCIAGVEGWIENKAVLLPHRQTTRVLGPKGLSVEQIAWHKQQFHTGGLSFVFVHAKPYRVLLRATPLTVEAINEAPLSRLVAMSCWVGEGSLKTKDWELLFQALGDGRRVS